MRDEDHGGVERLELALEPLDALHVQVVRRLVQEYEIRVAGKGSGQRGACQLSAGERVQEPIEVSVREAQAPHDAGRPVTPGVAARVLEPRLRVGVPRERRLVVVARGHCLLERPQLLLERDPVRGAGEHVLPQCQPLLERRALVVERDARASRTRARRPPPAARLRASGARSSCPPRSGRRARAGRGARP